MFSTTIRYLPKPADLDEGAVKRLRNLFDELKMIYNLVYGFLSQTTPDIKAQRLSNADMTDFGYLCRELAQLFDELRKECKARQELCGSIIAYNLTQEYLRDPSLSMTSKGRLATGVPDVKIQTAFPNKHTNEYYKLTDYFGVPREVAESGVLKLDWNRVTELCTELARAGESLPDGFGEKYPVYVTTFRKTREG